MDVSKLEGADLDLAVAVALGHYDSNCFKPGIRNGTCYAYVDAFMEDMPLEFSSNWEQGGPLIEKHGICLNYNTNTKTWNAGIPGHATKVGHPEVEIWEHCVYACETPLIAAMRAFVASKS